MGRIYREPRYGHDGACPHRAWQRGDATSPQRPNRVLGEPIRALRLRRWLTQRIPNITAPPGKALIGERWRIGPEVVLEVTCGRIPCLTFQGHLGEKGWVKRFTQKGAPGAYLRVIEPGEIRSGDPVEIVHRPDHDVTVALQFRAVTTERALLPRLLAAGDALHPDGREAARRYLEKYGS